MTRSFPTVIAPDIEAMAQVFFEPFMTPTPVATRLPDPLDRNDTTLGFLRIEAAGGVLDRNGVFYDMGIILHGYSPNEVLAAQICGKAVAHGANAKGSITTVDGYDWYVTESSASAVPTKQSDPTVSLTRYRAMVTWRIPGRAI